MKLKKANLNPATTMWDTRLHWGEHPQNSNSYHLSPPGLTEWWLIIVGTLLSVIVPILSWETSYRYLSRSLDHFLGITSECLLVSVVLNHLSFQEHLSRLSTEGCLIVYKKGTNTAISISHAAEPPTTTFNWQNWCLSHQCLQMQLVL